MRATTEQIPLELQVGDITTRGVECGDQLLRHLDLPPGTDFAPLLAGLPGDRCDCPHWGTVLAGSITVRFADGIEETVRAGEVYYWPGGHTARSDDGVTFLEWSPAVEIAPVLEHLAAQLVPAGDA